MFKEYLHPIKNLLHFHKPHSDKQSDVEPLAQDSAFEQISSAFLLALGGVQNIGSCREVVNSRRIRITLNNPKLVNQEQLEKLDFRLFMCIGNRIIHFIP